ncbi:hypothetical protein V3C99_013974 [Haemonchus contortus]
MDLQNVPADVKTYIMNAIQRASRWHLPNGDSWKNSKALKIKNAAVVGGGTMGRGIAIALCRAGYHTTLVENDAKSLEMCRRGLATTCAREQELGRFTPSQCEELEKGIRLTTDLSSLGNCDLVIEAVFEKMKLKTELFSKLDRICPPTTVFATNTSSLDIDEMSSVLHRRDRLVGMHFFNPAHIIKMVEVVHGNYTSAEAVATVFAVCFQMKKVPILVGNCPSFVFNRLLGVYLNQAQKLLYQYGMFPHDVDKLLKSFGLIMGPFTVADMNGLDVGALLKKEHNYPRSPIEKELLQLNRFGRKTGRGFYAYDSKTQKKSNDMEVEAIIRKLADGSNYNIRLLCDSDVLEFVLFPMVNEGFLCVEEGMIEDESLIDIMFLMGFGWPLVQGGPMRWGRSIGLSKIAESVAHWQRLEPHDRSYQLSKSLAKCIQERSHI